MKFLALLALLNLCSTTTFAKDNNEITDSLYIVHTIVGNPNSKWAGLSAGASVERKADGTPIGVRGFYLTMPGPNGTMFRMGKHQIQKIVVSDSRYDKGIRGAPVIDIYFTPGQPFVQMRILYTGNPRGQIALVTAAGESITDLGARNSSSPAVASSQWLENFGPESLSKMKRELRPFGDQSSAGAVAMDSSAPILLAQPLYISLSYGPEIDLTKFSDRLIQGDRSYETISPVKRSDYCRSNLLPMPFFGGRPILPPIK